MWKIDNTEEAIARLESFPHAPAAYYRYSGPDAVPRSGCTPGTRDYVLQDLRDWVHYGKSQNIRWLNGTSGVGKTAVAYSLCEYLESTGKPLACVFCSRQNLICRDVNRILPTISYQLARQSLPFQCTISKGLEQGLELLRLPFDDQFRKLIAAPLGLIGHTFMAEPVIVIDGIEECEDKDMVYRLLRVLVDQIPKLPVKLLVSILPSRMTHKCMHGTPSERHLFELRLHEIDHIVARNDVSTYLAAKLQDLDLPATDLERLAQRSKTSFVYATALVQYLSEANPSERAKRLKWLLGVSDPADPNYFDPNVLYTFITSMVLHGETLDDSTRGELLTLLRTAVHKGAPPTIDVTTGIVGLNSGHILPAMLSLLLPVLYVSDSGGLSSSLEKAFATCLRNQSQSDRLHQSPEQAHMQLARGCFDAMMSADPLFNFCELESSCLLDREVPYLEDRVNDMISPTLLYACLHWGAHLERAAMTEDLCSQLDDFLSTRLLLWMEILSLTNRLASGVTLLRGVGKRLPQLEVSTKTIRLVEDACEFLLIFSNSPMAQSTPHIYISALQFWSRDGPFVECYSQRVQKLVASATEWPPRLTQLNTTFDLADRRSGASNTALETNTYELSSSDSHREEAAAQPLSGHTRCVRSVAYSPDGACIASGSDDNTVRIWNARTGKPVGRPLTGHTSSVLSVAYSPDGAYIASGSTDKTIRIWGAHTSQPIGQPLTGHTGYVYSVAYSPDGGYIASGSSDNTVRIWNAHIGKSVGQPLTGHTDWVLSVAYSPDGAYIVSGALDKTIWLWDVRTGQPAGQPLINHTSSVWSVAYSPDGAYIASGSFDNTIRIWGARTGTAVGQPLTGHTRLVYSVAYSPDDTCIASGSDDKTIWIWDARTGKPIGQPLGGHTSSLRCVSYSPDGAYIVSSSDDRSIRIWFAPTRSEPELVGPPISSRHPAIEPPRPSFWTIPKFTNRTTRTTGPKHIHKLNNPKPQDAIDTSITASPRDWTLNEDGWVLGPERERLLWVPRDLRDAVAPPGVKIILSNKPCIGLDFREARLGLDWQQCYNPL
ncbi:hypothetical protein FRC12_009418 [Ceratobasidium sp. 428]|nr:hypothetical protein FRC12_009418 [Ceratobasidium sp. 428]